SELEAAAPPSCHQLAYCRTHFDRHPYRLLGRVGAGQRIVKIDHQPVTGKMIERPLKASNQRPDCGMKLAQDAPDLLRLAGRGKGGVAAQIAEYDDNVAAVAFAEGLLPRGAEQLGALRPGTAI